MLELLLTFFALEVEFTWKTCVSIVFLVLALFFMIGAGKLAKKGNPEKEQDRKLIYKFVSLGCVVLALLFTFIF